MLGTTLFVQPLYSTNNNSLTLFNSPKLNDLSFDSSYSTVCVNYTDKYDKNIRLINSFQKLDYNWNGYGAEKISKTVIDKAIGTIHLLRVQPDVFPTGRNSIQFEYEKSNGDYLEFEFFENYIEMFSIISENESEAKVDSQDLIKMVEDFYA